MPILFMPHGTVGLMDLFNLSVSFMFYLANVCKLHPKF